MIWELSSRSIFILGLTSWWGFVVPPIEFRCKSNWIPFGGMSWLSGDRCFLTTFHTHTLNLARSSGINYSLHSNGFTMQECTSAIPPRHHGPQLTLHQPNSFGMVLCGVIRIFSQSLPQDSFLTSGTWIHRIYVLSDSSCCFIFLCFSCLVSHLPEFWRDHISRQVHQLS